MKVTLLAQLHQCLERMKSRALALESASWIEVLNWTRVMVWISNTHQSLQMLLEEMGPWKSDWNMVMLHHWWINQFMDSDLNVLWGSGTRLEVDYCDMSWKDKLHSQAPLFSLFFLATIKFFLHQSLLTCHFCLWADWSQTMWLKVNSPYIKRKVVCVVSEGQGKWLRQT